MLGVPQKMKRMITGYTWQRINIGCSEASTYLLKKNHIHCYLKIQSTKAVEPLLLEKDRMNWLRGKLSVPEVIYYEQYGGKEYLLITEIAGNDASDSFYKEDPACLIKLLAKGLREIHSISAEECPFQRNLDVMLKEARGRVEKNLVDLDNLDEERRGKCAEELFQELINKQPKEEDLVFTHGDYCLPNIIIHNHELSGFVDLGRAGIADRYQDIALAVRSIRYNYGEHYTPLFVQEYGIEKVEQEKIEYYQLLDEFF